MARKEQRLTLTSSIRSLGPSGRRDLGVGGQLGGPGPCLGQRRARLVVRGPLASEDRLSNWATMACLCWLHRLRRVTQPTRGAH